MGKLASAFAIIPSLMIVSHARADIKSVSASIGDMHGKGAFAIDGSCSVCTPSKGLSNFSFSVDGDVFRVDKVTYFRGSNSLSAILSGDDETFWKLVLTPSGNVQLERKEHRHAVVFHGEYDISEAASSEAELPVEAPVTPLASVPEPGGWVLLASAVTALAARTFARRRS